MTGGKKSEVMGGLYKGTDFVPLHRLHVQRMTSFAALKVEFGALYCQKVIHRTFTQAHSDGPWSQLVPTGKT